MEVAVRWGTWEELVLGGAVLRHGIEAWDEIAAEVRDRSPFPQFFTPKECEAKYEDLQERYSGCDAWFDELRKRRVAELKRELEKSEGSIGSLQSKLESLTSERECNSNFGYNTSRTESTSPNEDGIASSSKEVSKDGSSAGSFTEKTSRDWSTERENMASVSTRENDIHMQALKDSMNEKVGCGYLGISFGNLKGKRGKRKRKGCIVAKEGSVGDSETLSSAAFIDREGLSEGCNQEIKIHSEDSGGSFAGEDAFHMDLAGIMDSIIEHKDVSIFRRRLESQKRARYKKMIRRHVDLQNIWLRIRNGSISSSRELFRELLLLSNNILVFYPKDSLEYKSALVLRDLVNKTFTRHHSSSQSPTRSSEHHGVVPEEAGKAKRLQSMQLCKNIAVSKGAMVASKGDGTPVVQSGKKAEKAEKAVLYPPRKRSSGRPVKVGQRDSKKLQEKPNRGRKRARR